MTGMQTIASRIKGYVTTLNTSITDDAKLLLIVNSIMNRALAYTNRQQLVYYYELAITNGIDVADPTQRVDAPIPTELEIALAETVISAYRSAEAKDNAVVGAVKSVTDNGQTVSFGDTVLTYFANSGDVEVFSGMAKLLEPYRLPTVNSPLEYTPYEPQQPIGQRL